ncbi:MAG: hypothetical protein IJR89_07315 [Clostridia bacterium]|nr:hypothetical protein [Clostridia bacterium]
MKNRKRALSRLPVLLAACLLFAALAAGEVFAAGGLTVSVSSVEGTVGEEVRVSLRVEKNPGVRSLSFTLGYDPAVLTPVRASYGEAFGSDYATPVVLGGESPIVFNRVFREENKNVGVFAEVTFRILSAPAAETALSLARRGETGWTVLANGAEAEMTFSNGKVTVRPAETASADPIETRTAETGAETSPAATDKAETGTAATGKTETSSAATDDPTGSAAPGTETGAVQIDPPPEKSSLLWPILALAAAVAAVVLLLIRQTKKKK